MPLNNSRHHHSQSDSFNPQDSRFYSLSNNFHSDPNSYDSSNPWAQAQSPTTASDNRTYQPPGVASNGSVIPYRSGSSAYGAGKSDTGYNQQAAQYPAPRRTMTGGRQPEELHIPDSGAPMSDVRHYGAPPAYGGDGVSIHLQPSTPQHAPNMSGQPLPGTLQPGLSSRPATLQSTNTAPLIPTLPQISTQMQQSSISSRPSTMSHSHSYSRSSPGLTDPTKYKPFSNTPEQLKYGSPGNYMPQTPQGPPSYSPLGLSDIRPRADTALSDITFSPGAAQEEETLHVQTNSSYNAPWPIYATDWCKWPPRSGTNGVGKIAIGSYLEDHYNYIQILDAHSAPVDPDNPHAERGVEFVRTAEAAHSYPVTRILWEPPSSNKQATDLLATSGDHLRLWSLPNDGVSYQSSSINRSNANSKDQPLQKLSPLALLSNSKSPEHTAPITSLDWNVVQPSLIITSSIDTTCTIWDIPTLTAKTQLIAHDKEVYDVRFCANSVDVFVSCGADGSVRMFDLRSLEHSTIIYEPSEKPDKNSLASPDMLSVSPSRGNSSQQNLAFPPPLLRIAASPHDAHLLATFSQDSNIIRILDIRQPGQALLELKGHGGSINCIEWSSSQRGVLASGADDSCVLIWDLLGSSSSVINTLPSSSGAGLGVSTGTGAPNPGGIAVPGAVSSQERGPTAVWECGYEVSNLSWAPVSGLLGVCGGRRFWGVQT